MNSWFQLVVSKLVYAMHKTPHHPVAVFAVAGSIYVCVSGDEFLKDIVSCSCMMSPELMFACSKFRFSLFTHPIHVCAHAPKHNTYIAHIYKWRKWDCNSIEHTRLADLHILHTNKHTRPKFTEWQRFSPSPVKPIAFSHDWIGG